MLDTPRSEVPRLDCFDIEISDAGDEPLACTLPPPLDSGAHRAAQEATGLLAAFRRAGERAQGRSSFGKVLTAEQVPEAIEALARIVAGTNWTEADLPADPVNCAADVRAYYEQAAFALANHVPAARQAEGWFVNQTEAGTLLKALQAALKEQGAPHPVWFYVLPVGRR